MFDGSELNTRFIKANLLKYINHEPMLIHQNKHMDFFYMEDLISLVDHYIIAEEQLPDVDCSYSHHPSLLEIANYINTLGDHRVDIRLQQDELAASYTGNTITTSIPFIGLLDGVYRTYNKLKP